jgi:small conductance mechanosensitive channel
MVDFSIITTWLNLNLMTYATKLFWIMLIWIFSRIFIKKFDKVLIRKFSPLLKVLGIDNRKLRLFDTILDITVYILAIIMTLYILELTTVIYTVLTAAGVMGIIIGFAVKEIAANLISGILIKLNQPFIEGDLISIDNKYKGSVIKISLYYTDIVDYEGIVTSLPNATVINKALTNYSKQSERMINISVSVGKDNDLNKTMKVLEKIAKNDEAMLKDRNLDVFISNIKDYMVVLTLRFWVKVEHFSKTKKKLLKKISDEFKKNKIELAIPLRRNV